MPNGVRHTVGTLVGVATLPLLYYGLTYSSDRLSVQARTTVGRTPAAVWIGGMVATGLLLGVLVVWQRLSPMAPLISGLPLLTLGILWTVVPSLGLRLLTMLNVISPPSGGTAGYAGIYLLAAMVLLSAAISPSRWRGRPRHTPAHAAHSTPQPAAERPAPVHSGVELGDADQGDLFAS